MPNPAAIIATPKKAAVDAERFVEGAPDPEASLDERLEHAMRLTESGDFTAYRALQPELRQQQADDFAVQVAETGDMSLFRLSAADRLAAFEANEAKRLREQQGRLIEPGPMDTLFPGGR